MRLWVKGGMFLSAYLPLFLILMIRNWYDIYLVGLFVLVCLYSLVWAVFLYYARKDSISRCVIVSAENKTKESLNYIVPYIISFLGLDLSQWQDSAALAILLLILFSVYVNSDLLFVNPLISLFKYRIYHAKVYSPITGKPDSPESVYLLSKKSSIEPNDSLSTKRVCTNLLLEVDVNEGNS